MTVKELKEQLDNYGDHVEIKMLIDGELLDCHLEDDIAASGNLVIEED